MAKKQIKSREETALRKNAGARLGQDIIMMRMPHPSYFPTYPLKIEHYVLLVGTCGNIRCEINLIERSAEGLFFTVLRPEQIIRIREISPDFKCYIVLLSRDFRLKTNMRFTDVVNIDFYIALRETPVINIKRTHANVVINYFNLLFSILSDSGNPFRENAAVDLLRSFFYEAGYFMNRTLKNKEMWQPYSSPVMARLMSLLQKNFKEHRDVSFYARTLSLTPGHLYKVVKAATGRTVTELIEDFIIQETKSLLMTTNLSIKEISESLNFPSQSFFGKYFKRIAGVSPAQYRNLNPENAG